jgi:hypothetical protein
MLMSNIFVRYLRHTLFGSLAIFLILFPLIAIPAYSVADGDGWYLDGPATVTKSPPNADDCSYFGKMLTVVPGEAIGVQSWKDCSGQSKCSGSYSGYVTWTTPPPYMQPGSLVNLTMSEKTTAQNTCGYRNLGSSGAMKIDGALVIEVLEYIHTPTKTYTWTVKKGSPGDKLVILVNVTAASLYGSITYNYTYKGAGASSSTSTQTSAVSPKGNDSPGPLVDKLLTPPGEEPVGFVNKYSGTVYVSAGPLDLPPSQQKWMLVTGKTPLYEGWTIRTAPGSEALVLYSTGALVRTKESSWWDMHQPKMAETGQAEMYSRLFHGIYNFYLEKHKNEQKKFEVEVDRAIVTIQGTNFILEDTDSQTVLKVIEGTVQFKSKQDGQTASVEAGQMMTATDSGLGQKTAFDNVAEKASWGPMPPQDIDMSATTGNTSPTTPSGSSSGSTDTKKPGISLPKCPITTAFEVDPTSPRLTIFRNFRDRVLSKSDAGKEMVNLYYQTGTWIVDNLLNTESARSLVRTTIVEPLSLALNGSAFMWNN